jgi:hypothetical protein
MAKLRIVQFTRDDLLWLRRIVSGAVKDGPWNRKLLRKVRSAIAAQYAHEKGLRATKRVLIVPAPIVSRREVVSVISPPPIVSRSTLISTGRRSK